MLAALALGFGFDDGGEETGFAAAMTQLAAVLYVIPFLALAFALLLFLAARMPPLRSFFDRPLPWILLGLLYCGWLVVVPANAWFTGWSDGGGRDGPCLSGNWVREARAQMQADQAWEVKVSSHDESWPPSTRCVVDGPQRTRREGVPPSRAPG